MKKIYICPETIEVKIQLSHFITTSNPDVIVTNDGSVEAGSVESRRQRDTWDD